MCVTVFSCAFTKQCVTVFCLSLLIGVIFTSQTAVGSAVHALSTTAPDWKKEDISKQWEDRPVFVVGRATAQAGNLSCTVSKCIR